MKKLLLIIFVGFFSCKTQVNKPELSKKCLDKEQQTVISKGVDYFEKKLKENYPEQTKEAAYFEFITDWSHKKLKIDFFKDKSPDSIHKQIREIKIWDESIRSEENMEREAKLFNVDSMNPTRTKINKEISNCLAKFSNAEGIIFFLKFNSDYRLSPRLAEKKLFKTSESDLKNYENRMAIVLGVYYQTAYNIN